MLSLPRPSPPRSHLSLVRRSSPTGRSPQERCEENLLLLLSCSFSGTIIESTLLPPLPLRSTGCEPSLHSISSPICLSFLLSFLLSLPPTTLLSFPLRHVPFSPVKYQIRLSDRRSVLSPFELREVRKPTVAFTTITATKQLHEKNTRSPSPSSAGSTTEG